jgi:hypothetical protein
MPHFYPVLFCWVWAIEATHFLSQVLSPYFGLTIPGCFGKKNENEIFIRRFYRIAPIYYLGILYYTVTFIFKLPFGLVRNQRFLYLVLFLIIFFTWHKSFWSIVWFLEVGLYGDDVYLFFPFIFYKDQKTLIVQWFF